MDIPQMLVAWIIATYEEVVMNGWISFIVGLFIGTIGGMVIQGLLQMASTNDDERYGARQIEDGEEGK